MTSVSMSNEHRWLLNWILIDYMVGEDRVCFYEDLGQLDKIAESAGACDEPVSICRRDLARAPGSPTVRPC